MISELSKTSEVLERHKRVMFPAVTPLFGDNPIVVERAKDQYIWDVEGKRYLDFFGGVLTVSVGHCNEEVTAKTNEQLYKAQHTSTLYVNEVMVQFAEKLAAITPGRLQKSFFTNSGSEANETAIMAARLYTGNRDVLALRHAYSGRTMLTMSLAGQGTWRMGHVFDGNIKHVRNPYVYRAPFGLDEDKVIELCVQDLIETIETSTDGRIAAFIAEPIQGAGGFIVAPHKYFERVLPIVKEAGGVFICDEVQTGWGRTGHKMFGIEHWGVEPDIMTFAKGIANGSPLGATIATPEVADAAVGKITFSTFGGNPVTMATALATVDVIESNNLVDNAAERGSELRARLEAFKDRFDFIGDVRGMGLMQALEIVHPHDQSPDPAKTSALVSACRDHGLLIGKGGLWNNVTRIAPPLNISQADVETAGNLLERSLSAIA
ncbi:MAG: aspartate aminotransferase family protein [Deinococcota bacterium]